MTNYNQRSKFGGGSRNRSEGRDSRQGTEMYNAICADCRKTCQVPFKPNGMKPVYCKDCFGKNGGQVTPRESSPKSYGQNTRSFASAPRPFVETKKDDGQTKLLESLNTKLDKLINLAERVISKGALSESIKEIVASEEKAKTKKVSKKAKKE